MSQSLAGQKVCTTLLYAPKEDNKQFPPFSLHAGIAIGATSAVAMPGSNGQSSPMLTSFSASDSVKCTCFQGTATLSDNFEWTQRISFRL